MANNGEPEEVRIESSSFEEENDQNRKRYGTETEVEDLDDRTETDSFCRIELTIDGVYELTDEQKKGVIEAVLNSGPRSSQGSGTPQSSKNQYLEPRNEASDDRAATKQLKEPIDKKGSSKKREVGDTEQYRGSLNVRERVLAAFAIGLVTGAIAMLILSA